MQPFTIKSAQSARIPENASPLLGVHLLPLPNGQGSVFVIASGTSRHASRFSTIWDILQEHVEIYTRDFPEGGNIPRRFEQMLQSLNAALVEAIGEHGVFPKHALHAVIGVFSQTQIFTSGIGNLHAIFLHKTAKQRYAIYELDAQFHEEGVEEIKTPFVTVLDGELHPGDIFYVATRLPARELDISGLQDILVTLPPAGALSRIEQHVGSSESYGGICFQIAAEEEPVLKKENPLVSIEHLGETKEETAMILGEEQPSLARWIAGHTEPLLKKLSAPGTQGAALLVKRTLRLFLKYASRLSVLAVTVLAFLWRVTKIAAQKTHALLRETIQNKQARDQWKQHVFEQWQRMKAWPLSVKLSVAGGLLVIVGGCIGIISWRAQANAIALENRYQEITKEITEKREAADASLIYNNKEQAKQLLLQANALYETLPAAPGHDADIAQLRTALDRSLGIARGMMPVTPTHLADLSTITQGATWTETVVTKGVVYGATENLMLTAFPSLDGKLSPVQTTNGTVGTILHMSAQEDTILFIDSARHLGSISLTAKTINPLVSGADKLPSVEDIGWYNGNVYLLSAQANQIIKMRPQGTGYEAGTPWITSATSSLNEARALAIDGDVYVLTSSGIIKFSSGKEQPFSLGGFEPAMQSPSDIWTSTESTYLYILDPNNKRVLVFNKKGEFVTQYVSDELASGLRVFVDEEKQIVTVTTSSLILSFPAAHLQK